MLACDLSTSGVMRNLPMRVVPAASIQTGCQRPVVRV